MVTHLEMAGPRMKSPYLGERCRNVLEVQLHHISIVGRGVGPGGSLLPLSLFFCTKKKTRQVTLIIRARVVIPSSSISAASGQELSRLLISKSCAGAVTCQPKVRLSSWTWEKNQNWFGLFTLLWFGIKKDSYLSQLSFTKSATFDFLSISIICTFPFQC